MARVELRQIIRPQFGPFEYGQSHARCSDGGVAVLLLPPMSESMDGATPGTNHESLSTNATIGHRLSAAATAGNLQ